MNVPFCRIFQQTLRVCTSILPDGQFFLYWIKNRVYDIRDNILSKKTKIIKKWLI